MKLVKRTIKELEPKITIVLAVFDGNPMEYGFKTILNPKVGDHALVQVGVNKLLRFVKITQINQKRSSKINYKWVVALIDKKEMLATHLKILEKYGITE